MKIKYKLIISFILTIIFSSLPLSLFILDKHEEETISNSIKREKATAKILAQSSLNIFLMNGGDIEASSVDAREMITALIPGYDTGLVFADAIMLKRKGK